MPDANADLVAAARRGDQAAWDALVARYNGLLWSIASTYRLAIGEDADAIQNTWLRLVEHLDRLADPEHVGSWLATTVRRECLMVLRRRRRSGYPVAGSQVWDTPDMAPDLDAALLEDERDAALWRAVLGLPERCRTLLLTLMATPPPSYAEASAALGLPIGSIGPTRQRCLARLRAKVSGDLLLDPSTDPKEDRS